MALASPAYSYAPCRAAPCTDYHGSFCLNFTKCDHPLLADARNKGLTFCTDLIAYLLYYADIRSRQNICFTPNNSDLTELKETVSITANSGETYASLLNRLYALIDSNKITTHSTLVYGGHILHIQLSSAAQYIFANRYTSSTTNWNYGITLLVRPASSQYLLLNSNSASDNSNTAATGYTLTVHYR